MERFGVLPNSSVEESKVIIHHELFHHSKVGCMLRKMLVELRSYFSESWQFIPRDSGEVVMFNMIANV